MDTEFSNCLYFSTNNLVKKLSNVADDAFREVGLAPSHAFLLMAVNKKSGIQPSELSKILQLTPSTITRLVEKMERKGYLERISEGRATQIHPTEKCVQADDKIRTAWNTLKANYKAVLGERYTEVLTEMTVKAVENMELTEG